MTQRLQKILSQYGLASRREAERLLEAGRVRVNGAVATLGQSADPDTDRIELDGKTITARPELRYLMLNKPRGYVTTLHDEKGRRDVAALVTDCGTRVYPVGRLDMDSEGLLLFTNDGALANALMHPSGEANKVYEVTVEGWRDEALSVLTSPLTIDGYMIRPAAVTILMRQGARAVLQITIHEGRNRQIRKMCEAAGISVKKLKRIEECGVKLGDLKPGSWRWLEENEISLLRKEMKPEKMPQVFHK